MNSLFILLPFLSVFVLNLPFRPLMKKMALRLGMYLSALQVIIVLIPSFCSLSNEADSISRFLNFHLSVDGLSQVLLLSIGIVMFIVFLIARAVVTDESKIFNFVSLTLLLMAGMNGVVLVTDIFSLYVFLEITAISSFILIALRKEEPSLEAAFKYIVLSGVATMLMLISIALILIISGDTSFSAISLAMKSSAHTVFLMFALGIFLCGLLIKAGAMPFHGWLPDAYSAAPGPVSVLLAGIVTKVVGVYALVRIFGFVVPLHASINQVLMLVGAASIIAGALAALGQSDFKRMLAYSSISQVGYIILSLGCGTPLAIAGAIFHIFNHATFKTLLFVNAVAVEKQCGTRDMDKLSGLAQRMPVTGTTATLGFLSASGIPPLAGFWSKLIIVIALWMAGQYTYAVIAVLASLLTLAYFLSMSRRVFFGKIGVDLTAIKEAGWEVTFAAILLAAITVGVGVSFPVIINHFVLPLTQMVRG